MAAFRRLILALAAFSSGCGGSAPDMNGRIGTEADVAAAQARIDAFKRTPTFVPPGPPFDAVGAARGARIFAIPITSEVPFITAVEEGMRQAAAEVEATLVTYPNQGRPSQWAQGMANAIAQDADAIALFAQNPALLNPQIEEAEAAGIPVIVVRTSGEEEPCQAAPDGETYGTTCVPGPFEQAGRIEADWVIADSGGSADVLVITSNDARATIPLLRGLRDEFESKCPACKLTYVDVPIPDWAVRLQTEVQSALVRDPGIDYIIPIYDSMSQYVVPALRASNATEQVKIATFNGTPFVLKMLQDEDIVRMDVGENLAWVGWATVDQALRLIAEVEPARSAHTPLRVFDDTNIDEAGQPPQLDRGYGSAFTRGFRRLWGVTD